jgi:hypothetical protein
VGGVDSPGSGQELVAGSREHGDEPSGSGATELVSCYSEGDEENQILSLLWLVPVMAAKFSAQSG